MKIVYIKRLTFKADEFKALLNISKNFKDEYSYILENVKYPDFKFFIEYDPYCESYVSPIACYYRANNHEYLIGTHRDEILFNNILKLNLGVLSNIEEKKF